MCLCSRNAPASLAQPTDCSAPARHCPLAQHMAGCSSAHTQRGAHRLEHLCEVTDARLLYRFSDAHPECLRRQQRRRETSAPNLNHTQSPQSRAWRRAAVLTLARTVAGLSCTGGTRALPSALPASLAGSGLAARAAGTGDDERLRLATSACSSGRQPSPRPRASGEAAHHIPFKLRAYGRMYTDHRLARHLKCSEYHFRRGHTLLLAENVCKCTSKSLQRHVYLRLGHRQRRHEPDRLEGALHRKPTHVDTSRCDAHTRTLYSTRHMHAHPCNKGGPYRSEEHELVLEGGLHDRGRETGVAVLELQRHHEAEAAHLTHSARDSSRRMTQQL